MATYRSLRCDAPNLRIPRPLLSAVHPERRPTSAPLKFMLHTVHLQRASTVLLQHGSPTGSPTGSALRAHCGPRLSGKKRGGWYLRFCFIFAGARGAARRRAHSAAAPAGWAVALELRGCHRTFCSIRSLLFVLPPLYSPLYSPPRLEAKLYSAQLQGAHHAFSTSRRLLWLCVPLYCAVSPAHIARRAVIPDSRSVSCGRGCTAFVPALICNRASSPSPRLCVSTASPTHSVAHNAPCGLAVTPPPLLLCSALAPVPWPLVILSFATALSFGGSRYIKVARSWYYCHSLLVPFILYLLEYNNNTLYLNTTIH